MLIAMLIVASLGASDPDGVVATAPATTVNLDASFRPTPPSLDGAAQAAAPHGLSTDEQISRWLESRAPHESQSFPEADLALEDDRKVHGEFSVSIGTGGYRDYDAAVSLPIGENGRLDLRVRQTENGYPYGRYGYGYGYDSLGFNDGGHAFPGQRPGAAAEFETGPGRADGPLRRRAPGPAGQPGP
ncbi:hypothetical protein [Brevundimonas sp.]|uniref:hypothetical protein n=1 Tax=Brevundimonas sp. TaxID=1871086 RepID=UPI0035681C89